MGGRYDDEVDDDGPCVVNLREGGKGTYVGRGSKWGNPFHIGKDGSRHEVIAKYREWIQKQPELMSALGELKGRNLVCWCAPMACHAEVLLQLANPLQGPAGPKRSFEEPTNRSIPG